jgi:hypothetical protein
VSLKAKDEGVYSVAWTLVYRASLFGFDSRDFHRACDGVAKFVVVVQAENGRVAAAYNEDGFSSRDYDFSGNRHGFILSIGDDGSCGAQFDRNERLNGIVNRCTYGPDFHNDLCISSNCNENESSYSNLGTAYGTRGPEVDERTLFGQKYFRVRDYEVFKLVIELLV